ncbi:gas vesicle structural protein GvpA [Streptomyces fuscigenes]|uniref:gas vesicle structural protein GvpA n=1 Tax=Streptomyces fuscigenes TaxID=1528880 RepID=UPI001F30E690|nr:gas vesicle structural protein GvpA [Streptomyces fuscigenes]MCF3963950.1 gas vesicle structural protein GvpA [Streptomyces fuscigenes]
MSVVQQSSAPTSGGGSGNLYDVLELILDRGLVIDAFVRVSLVGIEILKIDVRVVVASVDTYLRFAEACNRLDLESGRNKPSGLTDLVGNTMESGAKGKSKGALSGAVEAITESLQGSGDDGERERERSSSKSTSSRRTTRRREE